MCWQFGQKDFFHFISKNEEVYFEILLDECPNGYDETTKRLFISTSESKYSYSFDWKKGGSPLINHPRKHEGTLGSNNPSS